MSVLLEAERKVGLTAAELKLYQESEAAQEALVDAMDRVVNLAADEYGHLGFACWCSEALEALVGRLNRALEDCYRGPSDVLAFVDADTEEE